MRYIRSLERKDVGLDTSMIPLGSCTMKLNAASEMLPVTWPTFSRMHPFAPADAGAGLPAGIRRARARALQDHRARRGVAAAEFRRAGRVCRPDDDSRLSPRSRPARTQRRPDPGIGARHQSGERDDGRAESRRRGVRQQRLHRPRRSAREGGAVQANAVIADGDVSVDIRRLRGGHQGDLPGRSRARRSGLHGRREHERAGRADESGGDRRRRLPSEPAQDFRDSAWRRRSRHGAHCRREAPCAVPSRPSRGEGGRSEGHSRHCRRAVGKRQHPADFVRLHPDAGRARA